MKKERRLVLHSITVIAIFIFGFLALGSTSTPKAKPGAVEATGGEAVVVSSETKAIAGVFYQIPSPERKAYTTLGLVFATSQIKFDANNREITSQEGIRTMLLREAQKLGADDILNLRIDENVTWIATVSEDAKGVKTTIQTKTITHTGSALAIKYNENPIRDPQLGGTPR
jgi:hypothetical protein